MVNSAVSMAVSSRFLSDTTIETGLATDAPIGYLVANKYITFYNIKDGVMNIIV